MYTDEDLDDAVGQGIFTKDSVEAFRQRVHSARNTSSVDEENFKLISSFNDIFVVIACSLLLFPTLWMLESISPSLGFVVFAALSWLLAEFFVLKRKMALPAMVLMLAFVGGAFSASVSVWGSSAKESILVAAGVSALAAYFHWRRFKVPITIAAGTAALIAFVVASTVIGYPDAMGWLMPIVFVSGLAAFVFAMYWDSSDLERVTYRSDIAFWLHLLSAPLIIHPVFSGQRILQGDEGLVNVATVIALYVVLTTLSIIIDRRAFMVSSLAYVVYAISSLVGVYGGIGDSMAMTGALMGATLLILSVYWHRVRAILVARLPSCARRRVPDIRAI